MKSPTKLKTEDISRFDKYEVGSVDVYFDPEKHEYYRNVDNNIYSICGGSTIGGYFQRGGLVGLTNYQKGLIKKDVKESIEKYGSKNIDFILSSSFQKPEKELTRSSKVGNETHQKIENFCLDELGREGVKTTNYYKVESDFGFNAFIKFKRETGFIPVEVEKVTWNCFEDNGRTYEYAGTLDSISEIKGDNYLVDWKTSNSIQDAHIIQLSGYFAAAKDKYNLKGAYIVKLIKKNKIDKNGLCVEQAGDYISYEFTKEVLEDIYENVFKQQIISFDAMARLDKSKNKLQTNKIKYE